MPCRKTYIDEMKNEIIDLYKSGLTYRDLANKFNISTALITERFREWKIIPRNNMGVYKTIPSSSPIVYTNSEPVLVAKCDNCGIEFKVPRPNRRKRRVNRFCSKDCWYKFRRKPNTICSYCGNQIHKVKYKLIKNNLHFCNNECYVSWERENPNKTYVSNLHNTGINSSNWKGGINRAVTVNIRDRIDDNYFLSLWAKEIKCNANHRCALCDETNVLNAHHIKSFKDYPNLRLDVDNGICLCKDCHKLVHSGMILICQ